MFSFSGFTGLCISLLSICILYEGIYFVKKELLHRFLQIRHRHVQQLKRQHSARCDVPNVDTDTNETETTDSDPRHTLLHDESDRNYTVENNLIGSYCMKNSEIVYLILSSILHGLYTFIGYTVMNAIMTFNIWVLVSVCAGLGMGYFIFRTNYYNYLSLCDETSQENRGIEVCPQEDPRVICDVSSVGLAHDNQSNQSHAKSVVHSGVLLDDDIEGEQSGSSPKNTGLVLVVGAEVHSNYH